MTDQQALLAAILAEPADDGPRLVYAGWLEEQGEAYRSCRPRRPVRRAACMGAERSVIMPPWEHWTDGEGGDTLLPADHPQHEDLTRGQTLCCSFDAPGLKEARHRLDDQPCQRQYWE